MPSRRKNAYNRNPATTSGSTHAVITIPPTTVRTGFDARCISEASARPSVFWPTSDDRTVNTSVSQTAFRNASSLNAVRKFSRPTKDECAWPVSWRSVKAMYAQYAIGPARKRSRRATAGVRGRARVRVRRSLTS